MGVSIRLNGGARDVRPGTTIAQLVRELELRTELVAVERNGRIVRRGQRETTELAPGDEVEIVTLVGGG